ncbi:MAG: MFS transporter [Candidatus Lokiarchaeota archaeon]|nr:MFS transporter [Candidatus Lokiarchaeota archaeon]
MESLEILNDRSMLKKKEKVSFFIANIGNIPIMTVINAFLLIFYTDVVGLNILAVAVLFLVARVLDGFNDPLIGYIVDHLPRTKWGKFRPYLVLGSLLCSLNFLILWLGPSLALSGKLIIAYVSYILIGITFDLMDIPLNSLIPVMSDKEKDRNSLSLIKGIGYLTGAVLFTALTIPFVSSFPNVEQGYHFWIIIVCLFVFIFSSLGTLGVKEKIRPISQEKYNIRYLGKIITNKAVFTLFIVSLITTIAIGAYTAAAIYFWTYIVGKPELIGIALIFSVLGIFIGFSIGNPLANRIGKKKTMGIGLLAASVSAFLMFITNPNSILIIFSIYILLGTGQGFFQMLLYGMQADNTDYVEWKKGYRAEGAIASLTSFIQKAGNGIGAATAAIVLGLTGYTPNVEQTSQSIQGIYLAFVLIPGLLALIAALIMFFAYPLTSEKNARIVKDLNERRKKAPNIQEG